MKKRLPSTVIIQEAKEVLDTLEGTLPKVISQPFWKKKIPMEDKIAFLKEMGSLRANIWRVVEKEYPEIKGKTYTVGYLFVEYEVEESEISNPT
jgi:hypothetical protein